MTAVHAIIVAGGTVQTVSTRGTVLLDLQSREVGTDGVARYNHATIGLMLADAKELHRRLIAAIADASERRDVIPADGWQQRLEAGDSLGRRLRFGGQRSPACLDRRRQRLLVDDDETVKDLVGHVRRPAGQNALNLLPATVDGRSSQAAIAFHGAHGATLGCRTDCPLEPSPAPCAVGMSATLSGRTYLRHGRPIRMFSPAEDKAVEGLRVRGWSLQKIARQISRGKSAVQARLDALARRAEGE